MASIPVTIVGVLTYTGLEVGGGPIIGGPPVGIWPSPGYPAHPISPGGPPPGIWPSPGYPAHPIAPGGPPPGIWPSPGYPAHPIAPGGPEGTPPQGPPSGDGNWAWSPIYGWVWLPTGEGDKPHPPQPPTNPDAPVVQPIA